MKVVIISNFANKKNPYNRANFIYSYFKKFGHECYVLYSDYHHTSKKVEIIEDENWKAIKTIKYKNNLSLMRILSHINFSRVASNEIKLIDPDLVYVAIPPNMASFLAIKKIKKINSKLIVDVVDLWPESLPIPIKFKKVMKPLLNLWKTLRDKSFKKADAIMFECDYYRKFLKLENIYGFKSFTIYLSKYAESKTVNLKESNNNKQLNIVYLGSINNLLDIELLIYILKEINEYRDIKLNIIGIGEKKKILLDKLIAEGIDFIDNGAVYEDDLKRNILKNCDLAINLYKTEAEIGLTYKSIDYLSEGIPLLNTIKGDTWDLISKYNAGFNISRENLDSVIRNLIEVDRITLNDMKKSAHMLYQNNFNHEVVEKKLDEVVKYVISNTRNME